MKKYLVTLVQTIEHEVIVEAENPNDAVDNIMDGAYQQGVADAYLSEWFKIPYRDPENVHVQEMMDNGKLGKCSQPHCVNATN